MITQVLLLVLLQPDPIEVQDHLRQACKLVWEGKSDATIERCVGRAMEALGTDERLRSRELQRMLVSCNRELEKLQKEKEK